MLKEKFTLRTTDASFTRHHWFEDQFLLNITALPDTSLLSNVADCDHEAHLSWEQSMISHHRFPLLALPLGIDPC